MKRLELLLHFARYCLGSMNCSSCSSSKIQIAVVTKEVERICFQSSRNQKSNWFFAQSTDAVSIDTDMIKTAFSLFLLLLILRK